MSVYDQRLEADLATIRARLEAVAADVEDNLRHSVQAVLEIDPKLANETVIKDRAVNQDIRDVDHLCHLFVVRHLPSGSHLRFISAALRLAVALERVGDYSVAICRCARQLESPLPDAVRHNIGMMGRHAVKALRTAVRGFLKADPDRARVSRGIASQAAAIYPYAFEVLISAADADSRPARDLFGTLLVFRLLQRTAEQAENICQQTLFAVTGRRKKEKRYRILFLDNDNALVSKLAEVALAESHPHAGRFGSAGLEPAPAFDPRLLEFCRRRGVAVPGEAPRSFHDALDVGPHYHVIVGLDIDPSSHFDVPVRTAVLSWDLAEPGDGADDEAARDGVAAAADGKVTAEHAAADGDAPADALYRRLMARIRDLMTTLGVRDEE